MITDFTQRWKNRKPKFVPPSQTVITKHLEVAQISEQTAKEFVVKHHYSASLPACRRRFGLFQKGELVGAAIFSHPVNNRTITRTFNCASANSGLELGRLILLDETSRGESVAFNSESWFIARCRENLVQENSFAGFVAFSDDVKRTKANGEICFNGHLGIVYAAISAAFLGRGSRTKLHLLPDGKTLNARTISKIRNGESGWQYGARILESFGAETCPSGDENGERGEWLKIWLARLTRPLNHPGNLRFAVSFTKAVKFKSLPYPRIRFSDVQRELCLV